MAERPQTVVKEQYEVETLTFNASFSESQVVFEVYGLTPDRTYEDRDVYVAMGNESTNINAEDAIKLGQALIKHGTNALMANMIQHQHIHHVSTLKRFIEQGYVEKLIFTQLDDKVPNFGQGFKLFLIKPVWKDKAPEFQENFEFETVYYPSPFNDEFTEELSFWEVPVEFVDYDREKDLAEFQKAMEELEAEALANTKADLESEGQYLEEWVTTGEETKDESGN